MINTPNPFFIATCQRSGGFFLMSLLNSTEKVGYVHEYLYHLCSGYEGVPSDAEVVGRFKQFRETALRKFPNPTGHWGSKADIREFVIAKRWLELTSTDPQSIKWIRLRRRNKVRQAISYIKAGQTSIWHLDIADLPEKKELARAEIEVDIKDLYAKTLRFFVGDVAWENFFKKNQINPHTIYYEDFIDESTWELTIKGIFDFLNVPYQLPLDVSTHRLKQAAGKTPESYKRLIMDMKAHLIRLEYTDLDIERAYELDLETF